MGAVYKRRDTWYIDTYANGRRVRRRVGTSKKVALDALKAVEGKIVRDEYDLTKADISIEKLIEQFLEYNRTNHRASTTKRYKAVTDYSGKR